MKRINANPKTIKDNLKDIEINNIENVANLKKKISDLKKEISELKRINLKLHNKNIHLKIANFSNGNKIKTMEKKISKFSQDSGVRIYLPYNDRSGQSATYKQTKSGTFKKVRKSDDVST